MLWKLVRPPSTGRYKHGIGSSYSVMLSQGTIVRRDTNGDHVLELTKNRAIIQ